MLTNRHQIAALLVAGTAVVGTACSDLDSAELPAEYSVTIENLTGGQPLTPPLVATHSTEADIFEVGTAASEELKEVAENGNLGPLQTALEADMAVSNVVVAVAGDPPPIMPGASVTFTIGADGDADRLSFVSMLICTNDGFTGLDALELPDDANDPVTRMLDAYDAGTELNTEDFADMVPPCPALTGVASMDPGTGMSDPALAENDVIRMHPGITGAADVQAGLHGWTDPVARVTITRVN